MRSIGWMLFILATGILYVRPQELDPDFAVQLFLPFVVPALLVSFGPIIDQFSLASMKQRPITVCVLGLLVAGLLSDLSQGYLQGAGDFLDNFGKSVLFYFLLVAVVDTPARLRSLLFWLVVWYFVSTTIVVLDFHGAIRMPGIKHAMELEYTAAGEKYLNKRMQGTGLFADANDICLNLSAGIMICLYGLSDRQRGMARFLWLLPITYFGYAISLTQSRGGLVMLFVGSLSLIQSRFRKSKAFFAAMAMLPLFMVFLTGRQANLQVSSGTSQRRVQLWSEGLFALRSQPMLGIGTDMYREMFRNVAHNSYVHAYVETGFIGGTIFFGAVSYALFTLYRLGSDKITLLDPELSRLRPYLIAILASYSAGMLTLTENYIVTTCALFGMVTVFIRLAATEPPLRGTQFDGQFVKRTVLGSVGFLTAIVIFVRITSSF